MFLLPDSMKISWICFMTVVLYKAKWTDADTTKNFDRVNNRHIEN